MSLAPFPTTPDVPALRKVLDVIAEPWHNPERLRYADVPTLEEARNADPRGLLIWNQGLWHGGVEVWNVGVERYVCGTGMCLAGWVCELDPDVEWWPDNAEAVVRCDGERDWPGYPHRAVPVSWYAERRLGLVPEQSGALFAGGNTLEDLQAYTDLLERNPHSSLYSLGE